MYNNLIYQYFPLKGVSVALEVYVGRINDHQHHCALCNFRKSSGSFNMAVFSVDVTSVVELGTDPDRRLSVTNVSCDAQVGSVDLRFSGGIRYSRKTHE